MILFEALFPQQSLTIIYISCSKCFTLKMFQGKEITSSQQCGKFLNLILSLQTFLRQSYVFTCVSSYYFKEWLVLKAFLTINFFAFFTGNALLYLQQHQKLNYIKEYILVLSLSKFKLRLTFLFYNYLFVKMSDQIAQTIRSIIRTESMNKKDKSTLYTFACECGKAYDSYPALYLHFKRTHKIKITTKISGVNSQTEKKEGERTFTYYFSNSLNQFTQLGQASTEEKGKLETVFQQFFKEYESGCHLGMSLEKTFWEFSAFVSCKQSVENDQKQKILHQIPNFFNIFIEEKYFYLKERRIYKQFCRLLFKFGSWLRFKEYTTYIVIAEEDF